MKVHIVGGGLAGSETAYYLAKRGHHVILHEMRPVKMTEVHKTGYLGELVCSNSLKSTSLENAEGLLKKEMEFFGSVVIECGYKNKIPAGRALAVDREGFAKCITNAVENAGVEIIREEVTEIDPNDGIWVMATGPATSSAMCDFIKELIGDDFLFFFDAASPVVTKESIDMSRAFYGSRYEEGNDYINCPMTKEEYEKFWEELVNAETVPLEDFDSKYLFDRCRPVEDIARTGKDALLFGPLKPVGLVDPKTGEQPYAVVQLRRDNKEGTLYNIVGFQTRLKWGEQKRVFRLIPCLRNAEFVRYGVVHRNLYIDSPRVLDDFFRLKKIDNIFFAGQITGVEGYVESAASGIYVGFNIDRILKGMEPITLPAKTMMGALFKYVTGESVGDFKPMYANFGLIPIDEKTKRIRNKRIRRRKIAESALEVMEEFVKKVGVKSNAV